MEQSLVDYIRNELVERGFPLPAITENDNHLIVYEQDSYKHNLELDNIFRHASKCSSSPETLWQESADYGKPEFVIINTHSNLALVIECKSKIANHCSKKLREDSVLSKDAKSISRFSCDGALHYAKFLSITYDVIAIAVSGNPNNYKIDSFAWKKEESGEMAKRGHL